MRRWASFLALLVAAYTLGRLDPWVWQVGPYHEPAMWTTWLAFACILVAAWIVNPPEM